MDASQHYAAALGLMDMVVEHKDDVDEEGQPTFTPENAVLLVQSAQAQAVAGILRYLLDRQPDG